MTPRHQHHQAPEWLDRITAHHQRVAQVLGDVSRVLDRMTPQVISAQSWTLDVNGQATAQYRVPFQCLVVDSQSAHALVIANQPLSEVPGTGPGVGFVRVGGTTVWNANGYTWSVYGGVQGEVITVTAYANPQQPYAR